MVGTEQASFDIQSREFEKYTWELRTETEQRLREAEERFWTKVDAFLYSLLRGSGP